MNFATGLFFSLFATQQASPTANPSEASQQPPQQQVQVAEATENTANANFRNRVLKKSTTL